MSGTVLITGGTGFLGMAVLARLLESERGPEILLGVRAADDAQAQVRVEQTLARLYERPPASASRVRGLRMDLTDPDLTLAPAIAERVERVVHCAASIAFTLPIGEARAINVEGTRRLLQLARTMPRLERFVHVSTAYVAGRRPGVFCEADPGGESFRNTYERSKLEAELTVTAAADLPTVIVRPSIVVGESDSGWTSAFNVLYWPLQAFARGLLTSLPADPDGIVDMVPVDYVAEVIERATFTPGLSGRLHAVAGESAVSVRELIELACAELEREPPRLAAPSALAEDDPLRVFAPYFDVATRFDDRRTRALMGGERRAPAPGAYLERLLEFARAARWGKQPISREAARRLVYAA